MPVMGRLLILTEAFFQYGYHYRFICLFEYLSGVHYHIYKYIICTHIKYTKPFYTELQETITAIDMCIKSLSMYVT